MGAKKTVTFIIEYNEDGSKAIVTQDTDTDVVTLTYLWVKILDTLATQAEGQNKALVFLKRVYNEFKAEFGMS